MPWRGNDNCSVLIAAQSNSRTWGACTACPMGKKGSKKKTSTTNVGLLKPLRYRYVSRIFGGRTRRKPYASSLHVTNIPYIIRSYLWRTFALPCSGFEFTSPRLSPNSPAVEVCLLLGTLGSHNNVALWTLASPSTARLRKKTLGLFVFWGSIRLARQAHFSNNF